MANIKRLKKLVRYASTCKRTFDFKFINGGRCDELDTIDNVPNAGPRGCLMGMLPFIWKPWTFSSTGFLQLKGNHHEATNEQLINRIATWFDITPTQMRHVFFPCHQEVKMYGGLMLNTSSNKIEVMMNLNLFIKHLKNKKP